MLRKRNDRPEEDSANTMARREFLTAGLGLAAALLLAVAPGALAQKPWIVPIPGTTQMAHMVENSGAAAVHFTPSELTELNAAVRAIEVRGQRLPDMVLAFSGVEAPPKR